MGEAKSKGKKKLPYIFIATPMYGGMCTGGYTNSLTMMVKNLVLKKIDYTLFFRYNESLIDRARNALAANFLATEATHLLFIDADIEFDAEEVLAMVDADKDVICGIYPTKSINWNYVEAAVKNGIPADQLENYTANWVVNFVDYRGEETVKTDTPFEIYNGGTGMMLIKREVLEKMATKVESYVVNEQDPVMKNFKKVPRFFMTSICEETGVLLSEDYHFCKVWRNMGGKIYAAPWVNLNHMGSYVFSGRPQRRDKP